MPTTPSGKNKYQKMWIIMVILIIPVQLVTGFLQNMNYFGDYGLHEITEEFEMRLGENGFFKYAENVQIVLGWFESLNWIVIDNDQGTFKRGTSLPEPDISLQDFITECKQAGL